MVDPASVASVVAIDRYGRQLYDVVVGDDKHFSGGNIKKFGNSSDRTREISACFGGNGGSNGGTGALYVYASVAGLRTQKSCHRIPIRFDNYNKPPSNSTSSQLISKGNESETSSGVSILTLGDIRKHILSHPNERDDSHHTDSNLSSSPPSSEVSNSTTTTQSSLSLSDQSSQSQNSNISKKTNSRPRWL